MRAPWTQYPVSIAADQGKEYRLSWILRTNEPGLHGWSSHTRMFATADEAIAAANAPMGIAYKTEVMTRKDGKGGWKLIFQRRR